MKLPRLISVALVAACFAGPAWAQGAGDAAVGKQKTQMCEGCHGLQQYRTAYPEVYSVPKLGGQGAGYMVKALQDYKSGARQHPSMRGIASSLSDQDMADLAAYYSGESAK